MPCGVGLSFSSFGNSGSGGGLQATVEAASGVLLTSMLDAANYSLSGSDVVSIEELIQGDTISASGNPQYSATGFNSGPGAVHDGTDDSFIGSNATIVAALTDDTAVTLIMAIDSDDPDNTKAYFGAGNSGVGSDSTKKWGNVSTGPGRYRYQTIDDVGSSATTDSGNDSDANPHVLRWIMHGDGTVSLYVDGVLDIDAVAHDPGTLTVDQWGIFCRPDQGPDGQEAGSWGIYAVCATGTKTATDAAEQAIADAVGITLS